MAADVSFWIFSINPGSSAIFFLSTSISAAKSSTQLLVQLSWQSSPQMQLAVQLSVLCSSGFVHVNLSQIV
jgi:hypothetical protein